MSRIYRLVLPIFFNAIFLKNHMIRAVLFCSKIRAKPSLGLTWLGLAGAIFQKAGIESWYRKKKLAKRASRFYSSRQTHMYPWVHGLANQNKFKLAILYIVLQTYWKREISIRLQSSMKNIFHMVLQTYWPIHLQNCIIFQGQSGNTVLAERTKPNLFHITMATSHGRQQQQTK